MFEKIPASNRWISLESKDLLEGKNQITAQLRNGFSIIWIISVNMTFKILMLVVIKMYALVFIEQQWNCIKMAKTAEKTINRPNALIKISL